MQGGLLAGGGSDPLLPFRGPSPTTPPLLPADPGLCCGSQAGASGRTRAGEGQGAQAGQARRVLEPGRPRSPMKSAAQVLM